MEIILMFIITLILFFGCIYAAFFIGFSFGKRQIKSTIAREYSKEQELAIEKKRKQYQNFLNYDGKSQIDSP